MNEDYKRIDVLEYLKMRGVDADAEVRERDQEGVSGELQKLN